MYWLLLHTQRRWVRIGIIGGMVLVAIAVLGTFSRGGLLAIAAMGGWLWLKSRHKLVIAVLAILLIPPVLQFMPERWHARMSSIENYQEDNSSMQRLHAWSTAWNLARDRPFTGAGFDCFTPAMFARWGTPEKYGQQPGHWHDSHSIWFRVLAEHGFIGLGLYLLFWFAVWRTGTRVIKLSRYRPDLKWAKELASMCQVSLIGFWAGGTFINIQYWDYPFVIAAILVLTQVVTQRSPAEATVGRVTDHARTRTVRGVARTDAGT
jgi:probable O-glycosylation ligase (exosortase A-associated)